MAKKKKSTKRAKNPTPVTARKSSGGFIVSAKVATISAAKKLARKMGVRVANPSGGWMIKGLGGAFQYKSEAIQYAKNNGIPLSWIYKAK